MREKTAKHLNDLKCKKIITPKFEAELNAIIDFIVFKDGFLRAEIFHNSLSNRKYRFYAVSFS